MLGSYGMQIKKANTFEPYLVLRKEHLEKEHLLFEKRCFFFFLFLDCACCVCVGNSNIT